MMNPINEEILLPILKKHRAWVERENGGERASLCQCVLRGIDLRGHTLVEAILRDSDLSNANLKGISLRGADLSFTSLRNANLSGADLSLADLRFAILDGANLEGTNLSAAQLSATSFQGVGMSWFDHELISERLWRAAGSNIELRMVASFIGRTKSRCWDDYRELLPSHRRWILKNFKSWIREGENVPELINALK